MPMLPIRPSRPASRLALVTGLIALVATIVAGCSQGEPSLFPPDAVTSQGQSIRNLYDIVFVIGAAIFLAVEAAIIFIVLRYRRRAGDDELPPQTHGNNLVEVIWTAIPTVIVGFVFLASWQTLNTVDARSAQPDIRIRATAARFQWSFQYLSQDGQTVEFDQNIPKMYVPVGKTIQVSLHSPDVIHAFYVPKFLFKRDVVPGKENVFDFKVDERDAGQTFRGQCAELCGPFHGSMIFEVVAMAPADYDKWLQDSIAKANASPSPAPSAAPGAQTIQLIAKNTTFEEKELTAPADQAFTIDFENQDAGTQHNVEIKDQSGAQVFMGDFFPGPDKRAYPIPALKAGTYTYICTVHPIPAMTGTLTVK